MQEANLCKKAKVDKSTKCIIYNKLNLILYNKCAEFK